jgi:hypothetical protein
MPALICTGVVVGENFTNVYLAKSQAGVYKQVADFCRFHWEAEGIEGDPSNDDEVDVATYFDWIAEHNGTESVSFGATEVFD